jgi:Derlin-2/3
VRCRHGGSSIEKSLRNLHICCWRLWLPTNFTLIGYYSFSHTSTVLHEDGYARLGTDCRLQTISGLLLQNFVFTSALILAFIYTFAQDNRGKKAYFVIVQIPVQYLPWAMLTLTLIMGGWPAALSEGTGILAAHLYDFLTRLYPTFQGGRNWVQTPAVIKRAFGADRSSFSHKAYGSSFRAGRPAPQQSSSGWTSALSGSWGGRGTGRRLGGD